jgi:hypothetical protein
MTQKQRRGAGDSAPSVPDFDPVKLRYRRDGFTPERQGAVVKALAECGCVAEACRRVGISTEAFYELVRRPDAQSFRLAVDIALDNAVRRIGDNAFSRALNGIIIPHYYKGELVGEHRRWNEGLTMFILRYRDPLRYGKHLDRADYRGHAETKAIALGDALDLVRDDAMREAQGLPRTFIRDFSVAGDRKAGKKRRKPEPPIEEDDLPDDDGPAGEGLPPDVSSTSSTSAPVRNRAARRRAAARGRKR